MNNTVKTGNEGLFGIVGSEPLLDGEGIMLSWGIAWPRVIARAWLEEQEQGESGQRTEWYSKLMSNHPDMVLDALVEEGFIADAFSDASEQKLEQCKEWFKKNVKIVVTEPSDDLSLKLGEKTTEVLRRADLDNYRTETVTRPAKGIRRNGWRDVNGLEHVLVLTLPPKPKKTEYMAIANADYVATGKVYPFTCCC